MKIDISPEIVLSPLTLADATSIFLLVNQNREDMQRFFPWVKTVENREGAEAYIASRIYGGKSGAHWFSVNFRGKQCGVFGIKSIDKSRATAEVGYWLCKDVRGNGITNKIISSLSQFLAVAKSVKIIEFQCLEYNQAGQAVIEKAGASQIDTIKNEMDIEEKEQNILVYQLQIA